MMIGNNTKGKKATSHMRQARGRGQTQDEDKAPEQAVRHSKHDQQQGQDTRPPQEELEHKKEMSPYAIPETLRSSRHTGICYGNQAEERRNSSCKPKPKKLHP